MSSIISSPDTIENHFIHSTIAKLCDHGDVPSYAGIVIL